MRYEETLLGAAWIVLQPVARMVVFSVLIVGLLSMPSAAKPVAAQSGGRVAEVTAISSVAEQGSSPTLAVDPSGTAHAFWSSQRATNESETAVILYAQYREDTWTEPLDILMSPDGRDALFPRAVVDQVGRLHLVWSAPDTGYLGPLYYSWAPVNEASSVHSWQPPIVLAEGTYQSDIAIDSEGRLHLVYASVTDGRGICHSSLPDGGDHWESETCIPRAYFVRDGENEVLPRLAIDSEDTLHVVWSLDDYSPLAQVGYPSTAVFYAHSDDGGWSWSETMTVKRVDRRDPSYGGRPPAWGNVAVDAQDRVHIVWVGAQDMLRRHQWSSDGGLSWTTPQIAVPSGGYNQWQGLAVDSEGTLHLAWPSLRGLEYTWWNGNAWARPILIDDRGDPHHAQIGIALGHQLHILWQNFGTLEPGAPGLIMHARVETNAPPNPSMPVPILVEPTQAISTPSEGVSATSTVNAPIETRRISADSPIPASDVPWPLVIGLASILLLMASVLLVRIRARR